VIAKMSKLLWVGGILILLVSFQVFAEISERSEQYWEAIGPSMDRTLNPNKYKIN
jgi:hypothetical protein